MGLRRSVSGLAAKARLVLAGAALLGALAMVGLCGTAAAAGLNLTGDWVGYYKCETGSCAGQTYYGTTTLSQKRGSNVVTGYNGSETIRGTLTGHTFTFVTKSGSTESFTTVTISADGAKWHGKSHSTGGFSGTAVAERKIEKVRISGTVLRRTCAEKECKALKVIPVKGQQVELKRKGRTYEAQTDPAGQYRFRVAAGNYQVHLLGTTTKVEPEARTVKAEGNVQDLDFTLCKLPEAYGGRVPGCDLVEVNGSASDFYGSPVSGPEVTSDTDVGVVKGGAFSLFAVRGHPHLKFYRAYQGQREGHPDDFQTETVDALEDSNNATVKLDPEIKFKIAGGTPRTLAIGYEAWYLPDGRTYTLRILGTHRTAPESVDCSLEAIAEINAKSSSARLPGEPFEDFGFAGVRPIPLNDSGTEPLCDATYIGVLSDEQGTRLVRKIVKNG